MRRDDEGRVLTDVAGSLLGSLFDYKATKTTKIDIFAIGETVFYNGHKLFDNGNNRSLVDAGCFCDFTRYFCLLHFSCIALNLILFRMQNY